MDDEPQEPGKNSRVIMRSDGNACGIAADSDHGTTVMIVKGNRFLTRDLTNDVFCRTDAGLNSHLSHLGKYSAVLPDRSQIT